MESQHLSSNTLATMPNSKEYNTNTVGNVGRIYAQKASYAIRLNYTHKHACIYTFGELKRMEENQET